MFVLLAICLPRQGLLSYYTGESKGEIDPCVFVNQIKALHCNFSSFLEIYILVNLCHMLMAISKSFFFLVVHSFD